MNKRHLPAVLIAAGLLTGFTHAAVNADDCRSINADKAPVSVSARLMGAGWYGDPADGQERLYSPSCKR